MPDIHFYDNHLPVLSAGEYEITVTQKVAVQGEKPPFNAEPLTVYVNGPRFHLSPSDIHHVFPQDGAKGDFEGNLPNISFTRSTLLWEREPVKNGSAKAPWLFLLLVDESEASSVTEGECSYAQLFTESADGKKTTTAIAQSMGIDLVDDLQFIHQDKPIPYIDIGKFAASLIPTTLEALKYLGYTRIKEGGEEHCVAVGNRLPKPGNSSTVYLVSLENKYKSDGTLDSDKHIFPVLYQWKFFTNDDQLYSIQANIAKIDADETCKDLPKEIKSNEAFFDTTGDFKNFLKNAKVSDDAIKKMLRLCKLPGGSFHDVMSNLGNGITPLVLPKAEGIEISGSVCLPFQKEGTENAWYRGPLATQKINLSNALKKENRPSPLFIDPDNGFIPKKADDLMIVYNGKTDATYAAAYELGQFTALNDTAFSSAFFEWKHQAAATKTNQKQSLKVQSNNGRNYRSLQHLPLKSKYATAPDMPQSVIDKFNNWKLLKGLPIRYLVPHPSMVPSESIRYFKVDNHWVNAFIMGAFSIGHTPKVDFSEEIKALFTDKLRSGFILNSIAVSVWHDYELDCTTDLTKNAVPLRKSNLNAFVHLYLFDGQISELNFHLHPGKLHPGFLVEKSANGTTFHKGKLDITDCIDKDTAMVNIGQLNERLRSVPNAHVLGPAEFNGKLMEGTPDVRYRIGQT